MFVSVKASYSVHLFRVRHTWKVASKEILGKQKRETHAVCVSQRTIQSRWKVDASGYVH